MKFRVLGLVEISVIWTEPPAAALSLWRGPPLASAPPWAEAGRPDTRPGRSS